MAILRRAHGAATAWTTSQAIPYSASATAGDRCYLVALNTVMPGTAPAGWTSIASGTANGYSMNIYRKDALYTGTPSQPTVTAASGTGGVAWIEHYASDVGGKSIIDVDRAVSLDTAATNTTYTMTTASMTSAAGDWLVGFFALKSSATMSANATSQALTQASATLGTLVGQFGARLSGASPTNSLYYACYTRPVTTGASGTITMSATAGTGGANAAGPGGQMILREVQSATPAPDEVVSVSAIDTVTVVADASVNVSASEVVTVSAVPLPGLPSYVYNTAEGGSNGTTVTIGNSGGASGTAFSDVNAGVTYTNAQVAHGGLAYAFAGTGATFNAVTLTSSGTPNGAGCAVRFYLYMTGNPSATTTILAIQTAAGGSIAGLNLQSTGILQVVETGGAFVGNFTNALPLNQWNRVEVWIEGMSATNAIINAAFYPGDSTTPTESHQYTGRDVGTTGMGKVIYGKLTQAPSMATYYIDSIGQAVSSAQPIGPVTAVDATPSPAEVVSTASVPGPTVVTSTDATPTPASVDGVSAVPSPVILIGETPNPASADALSAVPASSVQVGNDASATPSEVVAATTVPAVSLPQDGNPAPGTVAAIANIWLMYGSFSSTFDPTVAGAAAAVPSPVVDVISNATLTTGVVAATTLMSAPTVVGEQFATASPAVVTAAVGIDPPTVTGDSNATPTPVRVLAVSAVPAVVPDVTSTALVDALSVDAVGAVDAVAVQSGSSATPTPSEAVSAAAVPAPVVSVDSNATPVPGEVTVVVEMDVPTVVAVQIVDVVATVVVANSGVPAATVDTTSTALATPAVVTATAGIDGPTPLTSSEATPAPASVDTDAQVGAPGIVAGSNLNVSTAEVEAVAAIPAPSVSGDSNVTPIPPVVLVIADVPSSTADAHSDRTATPLTVVAGVNMDLPSVGTEFNAPIDAIEVAAFVTVPAPIMHALTGTMGKPVNKPHVKVHKNGNRVVVHGSSTDAILPSYA